MNRIIILIFTLIISHVSLVAQERENIVDNLTGLKDVNARHGYPHAKHRGRRGEKGPRGLVGPIGLPGVQGPTGLIGLKGTQGIDGQTCNCNFASLKLFGSATSFEADTNINFHADNSANYFGGSVEYNDNSGEIMVSNAGNYLISYGFSTSIPLQIAEIRINGISIQRSTISSTVSGQMTGLSIIAPVDLVDGVGTISLHAITPVSLFSNFSAANPTIAFFEVIELD